MLSPFTGFENFATSKPDVRHEAEVQATLGRVFAWAVALETVR